MLLKKLRGKLLLSLLFGVIVLFALALYGDLPHLGLALGRFQWQYLPLILALALFNYFFRFVKWDYYLRQIGVVGVGRGQSLLIWLSGLSMVVTPGRAGEWVKSYLLSQVSDTPFSRSAPVVVAERLTDVVALALIASAGLLLFGMGWPMVAGALALAAAIVATFRYRPLAKGTLSLLGRVPFLSRQVEPLNQFYESSHILFGPKNLALAIALGLVSWLGEGVAFYLVLLGLGLGASGLLVLQSLFIFAAASLAGALLLVPGGLGVAEGGITGLSQVLIGLTRDLAAAGALIIRLSTLWFGVLLGIGTLFLITGRLKPKEEAAKA